jgi:hypothetical protein
VAIVAVRACLTDYIRQPFIPFTYILLFFYLRCKQTAGRPA